VGEQLHSRGQPEARRRAVDRDKELDLSVVIATADD
jgi:hypothetical protein